MNFQDYAQETERFLSKKFHKEKSDPTENNLKRAMERFMSAGNNLDVLKKAKYYGRNYPTGFQTSIPDREKFVYTPNDEGEEMLHGIIGIATESVELVEALYKNKWGGKEIDTVNLKEEVGDLMFYLAILFRNNPEWNLEEILKRNVEKLDERYGKTFSEAAANNRNTDKEREILEK